jgi:hypothetical protein
VVADVALVELPVLPLLVVLPLVVELPVLVEPVPLDPVVPVVDVVEVDDVPVPESIPGHEAAYAVPPPLRAATVAATAITFRSSLIMRASYGRLQIRGGTETATHGPLIREL